MKKEMIFMGRSNGMVRLALFDPADGGITRKLPFKEIPEELFIRGIKSKKVPVRGFDVSKGRITCKYGDWYTLPDVSEGALSLFGTVYFGEENRTLDAGSGIPYALSESTALTWYGLACVDWEDGTFRVLAPSSLQVFRMRYNKTLYQYGGEYTRARLKKKSKYTDSGDEISRGKAADYTFPECDSSESLLDIANWMNMGVELIHVFFQWVFQRCEYIGVSSGNDGADVCMNDAVRGDYVSRVALLGKHPIDVFEIPSSITTLALQQDRVVRRYRPHTEGSLSLYVSSGGEVECSELSSLDLRAGTSIKLLRGGSACSMTISGWEGWEGSGGNYTGLQLHALHRCFNAQPVDAKVTLDSACLSNTFNGVQLVVELVRRLDSANSSFTNFTGELMWQGAGSINGTFNQCKMQSPLDIRGVERICDSVNDIEGTILHKDEFTSLYRRVFNNTHIRRIKYRPVGDSCKSITIINPQLSLDVHIAEEIGTEFSGGEIEALVFSTVSDIAPKFSAVKFQPDVPVTTSKLFPDKAFTRCNFGTLDLRKYPNVGVLLTGMVQECKFNTIIMSDNVVTMDERAFIDCDQIRWVYIPSTVRTVNMFIRRPRIPYTIFTQKGSAADKYGKKNGLEVRYVDDVNGFIKGVNEVPDDLKGAVAVSRLLGESDGETSALKIACEAVAAADNLYDVCKVVESCIIPAADVEWLRHEAIASMREKNIPDTGCPRTYALISFYSQNSVHNASLSKITPSECNYAHGCYISGEYAICYRELATTGSFSHYVWAILRNDEIIHMFTERVSSAESSGSVASALSHAYKADMNGMAITGIGNVLEFTNITGQGFSIHGKKVPSRISSVAETALEGTVAPLGVYQASKNIRYVVGLDISALNLWGFRLVSGKSLDMKRAHRYDPNLWRDIREVVGSAKVLDSLDDMERMYSILGGADDVVDVLLGVETVKCTSYDTSLPESEIDALRVLKRAFDEYGEGDTITATSVVLAEALVASGLGRKITLSAWNSMSRRMYVRNQVEAPLSAGMCSIKSCDYVTVFVFRAANETESVVVVSGSYETIMALPSALLGAYDDNSLVNPSDREEHFTHIDCVLPRDEFVTVRHFDSGGCSMRWTGGSLYANILVSRLSGKVCLAATYGSNVVPIFWTNSLKAAFRIAELCGLLAFNHKEEWLYNKHNSICSCIFSGQDAFDAHLPDFKCFDLIWKDTRSALQRGEVAGYLCVTGVQEMFDLAVKHPPVQVEG